MHGVPDTLPLKPFVGSAFNQIALGRYQVEFHCAGVGSIDVEGRWELRQADGTLVDASAEHGTRDAYRLHTVLDVPIRGFQVDPPRSFTLVFDNGHGSPCSTTTRNTRPLRFISMVGRRCSCRVEPLNGRNSEIVDRSRSGGA
jgi:hypothetical protein